MDRKEENLKDEEWKDDFTRQLMENMANQRLTVLRSKKEREKIAEERRQHEEFQKLVELMKDKPMTYEIEKIMKDYQKEFGKYFLMAQEALQQKVKELEEAQK